MMEELDENDVHKIIALADFIVTKVLDELAPAAEDITVSNLALGALACTVARNRLQTAALGEKETDNGTS